MSDHEWCRDVQRDEAVRAAEDAAAVPSIQHRDLPEQVALLWACVGDLIGRVVRLEGEFDAGQDDEADAASDEAAAGTAGGEDAVVVPQMVVAGNFAQIHWNTCCRLHRMAMDKAGVRWTQSTEPSRPESEEAGNAGGEKPEPRGWLTAEEREASTEAMKCMTKLRRERDEANAECERLRVAHLKAVLERDRANESRGRIRSEWTRRGQALHAAQQAIGALNARVAELEAAAPPRGWLTAEEREAVEMFIGMGEEHDDVDAECGAMKLRALLARSSPPRVRVPVRSLKRDETVAGYLNERDSQWIAAIRAAGGEVEG